MLTSPSNPGELTITLIGGPGDGEKVVLPPICDCCGAPVAGGLMTNWLGHTYRVPADAEIGQEVRAEYVGYAWDA